MASQTSHGIGLLIKVCSSVISVAPAGRNQGYLLPPPITAPAAQIFQAHHQPACVITLFYRPFYPFTHMSKLSNASSSKLSALPHIWLMLN